MKSMASSMHHFDGTRGSAEPFSKLVLFRCRVFRFCLRPVKSVSSVDVPTKLRTAVADSSVSPVPDIRTDLWKRQRNVQGVLGVHVDDLAGGGNLTFQKAVQWFRSELEFGTWDQSLFRFRGRELSLECNRKSIKISVSKFVQEMEPGAVRQLVKDDVAGTESALSISWRCRSASVVTIARKSASVVCHWNPAEQVCDSPMAMSS